MKRKLFLLTTIVILIMAALSCRLPASSSYDPATMGKVRVQIRSRLMELMPQRQSGAAIKAPSPAASGNRAIAFYDRWEARIEDSAGLVVDSHTVTIYGETCDLVAPEGSGYTVYLEVYNSAMSDTEPSVAGSASGVNIIAGVSSNVTIYCLPLHTQALTAGTPSQPTVFEPYVETPGGGTGTELWFTLTPAADNIYITTIFDSGTAPVWGLFDSTGQPVDSSEGILLYSPSLLHVLHLVNGQLYYLVVLNYAGQGSTSIGYDI